MKRILIALAVSTLLSTSAFAERIGVSMAIFDDNFLTVLRNGMQDYSKTLKGVDLQIEDAQNDVGKQLNHIQNFIAANFDAIIVNPVDTDATPKMTRLAKEAGIPLVYVNRMPADIAKLTGKVASVASDEADSGALQAKEICRLMGGKGKVLVLTGELSNQAARQRTQDVEDVLKTEACKDISILDTQTGNWKRTQGADLVTNWISAGLKPNAIISNNDEMAIGAIQSLKQAGISTKDVLVSGIDATQDGLAAMKAGDLAVTVFQNATGQGKGAIDAALKLAKGEPVAKIVWIPFELVTPANVDKYVTRN